MKRLYKGCATMQRMLWIGACRLPQDGSRKAPDTALCGFVNQLDTAGRFIWNKVTRAKCPVDTASNHTIGGIIMVCVGIDVAKEKHDCFILSSEGEVLADVFTSPNCRWPNKICRLAPEREEANRGITRVFQTRC
jgi:hypothetical protein